MEHLAGQRGFWEREDSKQSLQQLAELKRAVAHYKKLEKSLEDLEVHLDLAKEANSEKEIEEIEVQLAELKQTVSALDIESKLSGEQDKSNAIVSLHAGAGGTEACDWTEMLLRMYRRWAESKGYETQIIDLLAGEEAGIKSVTFMVRGLYAYGYLKSEIGVHRLVRISPFDSNKRRHTSFASCDIIPEIADDIKIEMKESDLRIDTYRASGHGGQHVNKTDSAVRITHLPTAIFVACQVERSQYKNKVLAMKLLRAKLYELEQEKKRAALEKHYNEKGEIAWGNQIRSYVFMPYQLVKDLRTGTEVGNVQSVLDGKIDPFIYDYLSLKNK